jgi:hypothetical protein
MFPDRREGITPSKLKDNGLSDPPIAGPPRMSWSGDRHAPGDCPPLILDRFELIEQFFP